MKFGIHYIYWQKDFSCVSYLPYVKKAKDAGFDALELGDTLFFRISEKDVAELAAAARMQISLWRWGWTRLRDARLLPRRKHTEKEGSPSMRQLSNEWRSLESGLLAETCSMPRLPRPMRRTRKENGNTRGTL